jgi:poly(hydroxyalkanoate) depolymerase family esterase
MTRKLWLVLALAGCVPVENAEITEALSPGIVQVTSFGSNPAGLRMWKYVPANVPPNAPLVLALHACSQQAADYVNAGWNGIADKYGFYVVYPEQTTTNNALTCFNWAGSNTNPLTGENDPANLTRGEGENLSIKQMVDKMKADYSIDASRVFITGLSGGAAMTALMLATWPDVFAAGATFAGVPYHCTTNKNQVYSPCLTPGNMLMPSQWGDYVRMADSGNMAWPRISIWQGSKDSVVNPDNTQELMKQWTNVHGLTQTPTVMDMLDGQPHSAWKDGSGQIVVETVSVTGMDHGTPVDPKNGCGTAASYILDVGLCSSLEAAKFFGIVGPSATDGDGGVSNPTGDGGKTGPGCTCDDGGSSGGGGGGGGGGSGGSSGGSTGKPKPCVAGGCDLAAGDIDGVAIAMLLAAVALLLARRVWR